MVGAWVKTIFGPCFAGRSAGAAAAEEGSASSSWSSPCRSSSVTLMACSTGTPFAAWHDRTVFLPNDPHEPGNTLASDADHRASNMCW